jgi:hypothetical protein
MPIDKKPFNDSKNDILKASPLYNGHRTKSECT